MLIKNKNDEIEYQRIKQEALNKRFFVWIEDHRDRALKNDMNSLKWLIVFAIPKFLEGEFKIHGNLEVHKRMHWFPETSVWLNNLEYNEQVEQACKRFVVNTTFQFTYEEVIYETFELINARINKMNHERKM